MQTWEELHRRLSSGELLTQEQSNALLGELDLLEDAAAMLWYQQRQQLAPTPLQPPVFKLDHAAPRRD